MGGKDHGHRDSGNTDGTVEMLRDYPQVEVIEHPFADFASQCNYELTQIVSPWVLSLDADYELSDQLMRELACSRRPTTQKVIGRGSSIGSTGGRCAGRYIHLRRCENHGLPGGRCVLPTLNENFGLTVAEALAAGTPAISTKGASWSGLEREGCGWWIDHGVEPLAAALAHAMALPREALKAMGDKGREWMVRGLPGTAPPAICSMPTFGSLAARSPRLRSGSTKA